MSVPFRAAFHTLSVPAPQPGVDAAAERVEDIVEDAHTATEADARLRSWINHHDERVPLALISGTLCSWLAQHENWALHLYARAMRDADRDGVCWTPLLDRLAVAGVWPTQKGRVVLGGKVSVVHPLPVAQVIEPLRRWLREQTDGSALAPLAAFHATPVRALVQSRLAVIPAVASFTGDYGSSSRTETSRANTPHVVTPQAPDGTSTEAAVAPVVVPTSKERPTTPPATAYATTPAAAPIAASAATPSTPATAAPVVAQPSVAPPQTASSTPHAAYAGIGPHGVSSLAETRDQAAQGAAPALPEPRYTPEQVSGLMTVAAQAAGRTDEAQVRPEIRKAINTLIEYKSLPSEKLYSLYSACRLVKTWVVRIVAHVSATIELWRAALRDNNWIEVREAIVRSSVARRDSVIRLILSRCGSSDVLCALCLDGDMPDVPQIARRVRAVNPRGLLDALLAAARTTGLRLTAADLSPLVHHDDPEVRQRALSLLHVMVRPA